MSTTWLERANAARARAALDPSVVPHGTASGYTYWGCRCPRCLGAIKAQIGRWMKNAGRRACAPPPGRT